MKAAIITIGDEILIGQIVDTNSAWMAAQLTENGFEVVETRSIGDNAAQIKNTLNEVFRIADVILMSGGIGPTKDDITKQTLCEYFDTELVFDQSVLENVESLMGTRMNELSRYQAYVPKNCTVIQNKVGTAPICWFDYEGKIVVSMPGVPYEMKYNVENEILPRLASKFEAETYLKKTFIVSGFGESALAMHLTDFENNLPPHIGLAYLPTPGIVRLRLFAKGKQYATELENRSALLRNILGKQIISEKDIPLEAILGELLSEKKLTVSTAESCTGGNVAYALTSVAGSSNYFKGSVVSYANEAKENVLLVSGKEIEKQGAVSEIVAKQMAENVRKLMNTDCSISTTGIAGPDGGSEEKPVGTVWISTTLHEQTVTKLYKGFSNHRLANITRATNNGMLQLITMIKNQP